MCVGEWIGIQHIIIRFEAALEKAMAIIDIKEKQPKKKENLNK